LPKVKTMPVYKKPITSSFTHKLYLYYNKKYAFIHDEGKHQLIANFKNVIVLLINESENENKLLFSLACNPNWNDNKDINYSIIISELTIQRVREICNALYKVSSKDTTREPVILADKDVLAYAMKYPQILYYKLIKSKKGLVWGEDGKIELYKRSTEEEAKYKQIDQYIDDRYYLIGDQSVDTDGRGKDKYYMVYDELRIYDLRKRRIVETTSTLGAITHDYEDHEAFENIWVLENGIFVIRDKVIVRPIAYVHQDDGAIAEIEVDVPDNNQNEETLGIIVEHDSIEYMPIVLFCTKNNSILVTRKIIFIYELTQSSHKPSESHELTHPEGGIDTKRMKLYKYKNFFILIENYYIIAVYYDKKTERYYFRHGMSSKGKLYRFKIIGYVLSRDDNDDCVGVLIASQNREVIIAIYDTSKKNIYFSKITEYNHLIAGKKNIDLLSRILSPKSMKSKFVLQFSSSFQSPNDAIKVIQEDDIDYLNVVIDQDVKVVRVGNGSSLPLSPNEFYSFKFFNYILTHEQPCLVSFIKHR
jgi:hypothetical protein